MWRAAFRLCSGFFMEELQYLTFLLWRYRMRRSGFSSDLVPRLDHHRTHLHFTPTSKVTDTRLKRIRGFRREILLIHLVSTSSSASCPQLPFLPIITHPSHRGCTTTRHPRQHIPTPETRHLRNDQINVYHSRVHFAELYCLFSEQRCRRSSQ